MQHSVSNYSKSVSVDQRHYTAKDTKEVDIADLVKAVQADIAHIKGQLEDLAPFPKGKCVERSNA